MMFLIQLNYVCPCTWSWVYNATQVMPGTPGSDSTLGRPLPKPCEPLTNKTQQCLIFPPWELKIILSLNLYYSIFTFIIILQIFVKLDVCKHIASCVFVWVYIHLTNIYHWHIHLKYNIDMVTLFKVQVVFLIISFLAGYSKIWICYDPFCKCVLQDSTIKIQYKESRFEECPSVFVYGEHSEAPILP